MPQVIHNYGSKPSSEKGASANKSPISEEESKEKRKVQLLAGVCVVLVLIAVLVFRAYVIGERAPALHKVAPPSGYPDEFPYNTAEWQKASHSGAKPLMSGMPPPAAMQKMNAGRGQAPAGAGQ
jgi:hypothetical protein